MSLADAEAMPASDFIRWRAFYSYEAKVAEFEAKKARSKSRRR